MTNNDANIVENSETLTESESITSHKTEHQIPLHYHFYRLYIVFLLLALGLASFALYESRQALHMQKVQKTILENNIHNIEKQQIQSKEKINQNLNVQLQEVQTQLSFLSKQLHSSQEQISTKKPDWLLYKVKFYLEIAQINLKWTDNINLTIAVLQQADELLKDLNQQQIIEIRQAIAKEILELKALPVADITGLLTQVSALQALISSLEIKSASSITNKQSDKSPNKQTTWREKFQESLTSLAHLVIIKEDSDNSFILYSPRYEALLRENLRMDLKQAQWALIQKNQVTYLSSLNQAVEDLNRGFKKTSRSSAFSKLLDELRKINIGQDTTVNINSLNLLTLFLDSLSSPTPESSKGDKT